MQELFLHLLRLSMTESLFVLAVVVLRKVFHKTPKWLICILWGVVALRLVLPISLESKYSLIPESMSNGKMITAVGTAYLGETNVYYEGNDDYTSALESGRLPIYSENGYFVVTDKNSDAAPTTVAEAVFPYLWKIWLAGAVMMLGYVSFCYALLYWKVREATTLKGRIFQSEQVDSPFILGLFRPKIYLPYHMDADDMACAVAHEQGHIDRGDPIWKLLGFAVLSVHWFNPIMWVAYVLFCRDIEEACDERVIKNMAKEELQSYSAAILHNAIRRRNISARPLAFGEIGVKERVTHVMGYQQASIGMIIFAVVASVAVGILFATNPVTAIIAKKNTSLTERIGMAENENSYFGTGISGKFVYSYDKATGEYDYYCAVPGCMHSDPECGAYLSDSSYFLGFYEDKRAWIDDAGLWCSNQDGSSRQMITTIPGEILDTYNPQEYTIYGDFLYMTGVRYGYGARKGNGVSILRMPLFGGQTEVLFEETIDYAFNTRWIFRGNSVYLGVLGWDDHDYNFVELRKINLNTKEIQVLYEKREIMDTVNQFWVSEDERVFLPVGNQVMELRNGELMDVITLSASWLVQIHDGIAIGISGMISNPYMDIQDLEENVLYQGDLFPYEHWQKESNTLRNRVYGLGILGGNQDQIIVEISTDRNVQHYSYYSLNLKDNLAPTLLWEE